MKYLTTKKFKAYDVIISPEKSSCSVIKFGYNSFIYNILIFKVSYNI